MHVSTRMVILETGVVHAPCDDVYQALSEHTELLVGREHLQADVLVTTEVVVAALPDGQVCTAKLTCPRLP